MRKRLSSPAISAPRPRTVRPAPSPAPPAASPSAIFQALAQASATLASIEAILSRSPSPARYLHARNDELVLAVLVAGRRAQAAGPDEVSDPTSTDLARGAAEDLLAIRRVLGGES